MIFVLFENKSNVDGKFLVGDAASWYCTPESTVMLKNIGASGDIPYFVKKGDSYLYIGKNINMGNLLHFEKHYYGTHSYADADKPWIDDVSYDGSVDIIDDGVSFYKVTFTGGNERKLSENEIPEHQKGIEWYKPEGYKFTVTKQSVTDDMFRNYGRVIFEKIITEIKYKDDSGLWPEISIPSYTAWDKLWKTKKYKNYLAAVEAKNKQDAEKAVYNTKYIQKLVKIADAIRESGLYNN